MRVLLLMIIMVLVVPAVVALEPGKPHLIENVGRCYGDVSVKVIPKFDVNSSAYAVSGCTLTDDLYSCACAEEGTTEIAFESKAVGTYDLRIQYYIDEEQTDNGRRNIEKNGIAFEVKAKPKPPAKMPTMTLPIGTLLGIAFIILILCIAPILFLYTFGYTIDTPKETKADIMQDIAELERQSKELDEEIQKK